MLFFGECVLGLEGFSWFVLDYIYMWCECIIPPLGGLDKWVISMFLSV